MRDIVVLEWVNEGKQRGLSRRQSDMALRKAEA